MHESYGLLCQAVALTFFLFGVFDFGRDWVLATMLADRPDPVFSFLVAPACIIFAGILSAAFGFVSFASGLLIGDMLVYVWGVL